MIPSHCKNNVVPYHFLEIRTMSSHCLNTMVTFLTC